MEYLYVALILAIFGYIFVYRGRYNFGTKRVIENSERYRIKTLWKEFEIQKNEIERENITDMWSLSGFDINPFTLRFYGMMPFGKLKLLTLKSGRVIHHLIPVSKIEKEESNQAFQTTSASARRLN